MTLARPDITVYFGLPQTGGDWFTLDDPVKGVLDNVTYLLAGDVATAVDVDGYELRVRRGRNRELDEFEAGTAEVRLHNHSRTYDDTNAASPLFGEVTPGKRVNVAVWGQTIFDGIIEDWNNEWSVDGDAAATFLAVDALGELALREFDEWTTTAAQTAGPRLTASLNRAEVNFGINRDFDTGASILQDDLVTWGSNVLNYCQLVAKSDAGRFFATRTNVLRFMDRHGLVNPMSTVLFADATRPAYLSPTVGTVSTPDPGVLPNQHTFVFKVQGPTAGTYNGLFAQASSWQFFRFFNTGVFDWNFFPSGTPFSRNGPAITGLDEHLALSVTINDGGGTTSSTSWSSTDGQNWSTFATGSSAAVTVADSSSPVVIGTAAGAPFEGRIYSVELRSGLDPAGGTVLWRFDASDYPGSGTSYMDPRGHTWTLTDADALIPATPVIRFHGITTHTGAEFLFNRVGVDREGGTLQTVEDADSQAEFGVRALNLSGLLMDTDEQSSDMADHLLELYRQPDTRIASVMLKVNALDGDNRGAVTQLDIGDVITVSWTPNGVGAALTQSLVVEGVEHQLDRSGLHVMWLHTSQAQQVGVFILDDPVWGLLDAGNRLAF